MQTREKIAASKGLILVELHKFIALFSTLKLK